MHCPIYVLYRMNITQNSTSHVEEEKRLQSVGLCINAFVQRPALQQTKGVELWLQSSRVYCKNTKKNKSFCSQICRKYANALPMQKVCKIFHFPLQNDLYFKDLFIFKTEQLGLIGHKKWCISKRNYSKSLMSLKTLYKFRNFFSIT